MVTDQHSQSWSGTRTDRTFLIVWYYAQTSSSVLEDPNFKKYGSTSLCSFPNPCKTMLKSPYRVFFQNEEFLIQLDKKDKLNGIIHA